MEKIEKIPFGEQKEKPKIIVEIGVGLVNTIDVWEGQAGRGLKEKEKYIAIDIDPDLLKTTKKELELAKQIRPDKVKGNFLMVQADAKKLPIESGSVDEVRIANFLGKFHPHDFIRHDPFISAAQAAQTIKDSLSEAYRILKTNGNLVIIETNTPMNQSKLNDFLVENGFEPQLVVKDNWNELKSTANCPYQPKPRRVVILR